MKDRILLILFGCDKKSTTRNLDCVNQTHYIGTGANGETSARRKERSV
ncbi:hypothetical protein [Virgibacillus ainsalahensis]